ncbi:hypothetical protein RQP46_009449 [Phenoliferia psychrophenolica]
MDGRIVENLAVAEGETAQPVAPGAEGRPVELQALLDGNARFAGLQTADSRKVLATVAEGQTPKFAFVGCSDSRVPESKIFDSDLGALFTARNIGNQFRVDDLTTQTITSYAIEVLQVNHILITGHYGCGAVAAAIATPFADADTSTGSRRIETWIEPIRLLLATSPREELVAFRQANLNATSIPEPERQDAAFRALVEENVKSQVAHVAADAVVQKAWREFVAFKATSNAGPAGSTGADAGTTAFFEGDARRLRRSSHGEEEAGPPQELWIHGLVYDIDTGLVTDLGISVSSTTGLTV